MFNLINGRNLWHHGAVSCTLLMRARKCFPKGEFLYASLDKWGFVWDWREMRTKNQAWIAFQLYASSTPPARFTSKNPYLLWYRVSMSNRLWSNALGERANAFFSANWLIFTSRKDKLERNDHIFLTDSLWRYNLLYLIIAQRRDSDVNSRMIIGSAQKSSDHVPDGVYMHLDTINGALEDNSYELIICKAFTDKQ